MKKRLMKVISGIYIGEVGWASEPSHLGNVLFYPIGENCPYCIRLSKNCVTYI